MGVFLCLEKHIAFPDVGALIAGGNRLALTEARAETGGTLAVDEV